jgi:hypothetical protein
MPVLPRVLGAALAACALAAAVPVAAALYKWTDANGRVVYSDQPPNANVKTETLAAPAPAANPNAMKELAQKDADLRKRSAERADVAAKAEKDRVAKEQRGEQCTRIANALKQLSWSQVTIYRANDKGDQVPLDDAARQKERARLEALQKEHCA